MRVRKTHDLHHIVTAFSMIGPGELGVIAITALQYGDPAFMTKPLMGVRWEEQLDKPLDVWRRELNVEPIREGQNSWYTVLADLAL